MEIKYSQPVVQTIMKWIDDGELNLQPNFQRGEVWSIAKKQRLIDSVLRDWHVPPIHVIQLSDGSQEVLDGQQRLASIRDFVHDNLKVDGNIEPYNPEIVALDGLTFSELPKNIKRIFNRFTITVNTITDYKSEEPGELFYRLNQPIRLSSAEERNAFFGEPRQQVKELVKSITENRLDREFLGFSNSRMAYDDVIARLCYVLELDTLREKVESPMLANKYRSNTPFAQEIIEKVEKAIKLLGKAKNHIGPIEKMKFNRASLFSWLLFLTEVEATVKEKSLAQLIGGYMFFFEGLRAKRKFTSLSGNFILGKYTCPNNFVDQLMEVYIDKSTSRVTDVNSVLSREIILWTFFGFYLTSNNGLEKSHPAFTLILKHLELSTTGKGGINLFTYLDKLMEEWEMPK